LVVALGLTTTFVLALKLDGAFLKFGEDLFEEMLVLSLLDLQVPRIGQVEFSPDAPLEGCVAVAGRVPAPKCRRNRREASRSTGSSASAAISASSRKSRSFW
jgi:hypothetical protein